MIFHTGISSLFCHGDICVQCGLTLSFFWGPLLFLPSLSHSLRSFSFIKTAIITFYYCVSNILLPWMSDNFMVPMASHHIKQAPH